MKKFIALAIAIVMLAALAVPAFAATSGETTVTYSVDSTYTLTVPSTLAVGGAAGELEVSAYNLEGTEKVTVTATSTWKFDEEADENAFKLQINEADATTVDFTGNDTASVKVVADTGIPTAAGDYNGTITFTGAIVPNN